MIRRLAGPAAGASLIDVAQNLVGLITAVILARWLGPSDYGLFSFTVSLLAILGVISAAGLPDLLLREVAASESDAGRGSARTLIRRAGLLALGVSAVAIGISASILWLFGEFNEPTRATTLTIALLSMPALVLLPLWSNAVRSMRKVILGVFLGSLLPHALLLAFIIAAFTFVPSWLSPAGAMTMRLSGFLLAAFIAGWAAWRLSRKRPQHDRDASPSHRKFVTAALPFLLISGANIILARSDVVMLGVMVDDKAVGLYAVALYGSLVIGFALRAANMVAGPAFARLSAERDWPGLERLSILAARFIVILSIPAASVLMIWGGTLIGLIFGDEYRAAQPALAVSVAGFILALIFGNPGLLLSMTGYHDDYFRILLFATVANFILNLSIIPVYGMLGAAWTTAVCTFGWRFAAYIMVRRRLGIRSGAFDCVSS